MNTQYLLFAFDLDGTLLTRDGKIPRDTVKFLEDLAVHTRVTMATGRSVASARRYLEELHVTTPAILYHGALVFDPVEGRPLRETHIPGEFARRAFAISQRFPVHPQIYRSVEDPKIYVPRITPPIEEFESKENIRAEEVANPEDLLTAGPLKLLFIGLPEVLPRLISALREEVPELTTVRAERNYVEVLPPKISKGEGLSWLCEYLGIPLAYTVAVGDQESDISMIERAGLGVAMAHSGPELQARADAVISQISELEGLL